MADFLKKTYAHCVNAVQIRLYKEQQAPRIINLMPVTVISDELQGVPTLSLDHDLLFHVSSTLDTKHRSELNPSTWDSVSVVSARAEPLSPNHNEPSHRHGRSVF